MQLSEYTPTVIAKKAFYQLAANLTDLPAFVEATVQGNGWESSLTVPLRQYSGKELQKICPLLRFHGRKAQVAFDETLNADLISGLKTGRIPRGYLFDKTGTTILPDGRICFVRGAEVLGDCGRPYLISPEINNVQLLGQGTPPSQLVPILLSSPPQVLLVLAYVVLASIRSFLVENGLDLQAVLYIVGGQGLGKTTLATRVAGIYKKEGIPVGVVQAGSTHAAVNALMTGLRDQPIIIDDLCLSVSRDTARKRIELAAKLIRQGTGTVPIIKRSGNSTVELPCEAGLIMTAEFHLDNLSDLTRCMIVPVQKSLDIPDDITPDLIGDAIRHYSLWLTEHAQEELIRFHKTVDTVLIDRGNVDARIVTNYACLYAAARSFLCSMRELNPPQNWENDVLRIMSKALSAAWREHQRMIDQLKECFPVGNLPFCILEGYKNKAFDLAKKIEKLSKNDGIVWKNDLCLRREALVQFIRQQPGYHDWTSNRITRALKDINALALQEDEAATVRLTKEENVPRVYRIRLNVLKETAKKY